MRAFLSDLVYAARTFRKKPAFAITAIATLALGIGSTAAIFSVVNAVLLEPLPYAEPDRLVHVWHDLRNRNVTRFPWAPADFHDLRTQATMFEEVAALTTGRQVIVAEGGTGEAEQIRTGNATPNLFRLLGARIVQGSDFTDADGTPPPPPPPGAPGAGPAPNASAATAAAGDPQLRVLAAPLRREPVDGRLRRRARPAADRSRRRARAGVRAAVSARRQHRAGAGRLDADARRLCRRFARQRRAARHRPASRWRRPSSRRRKKSTRSPRACASSFRSSRPPASTCGSSRCTRISSPTSGR